MKRTTVNICYQKSGNEYYIYKGTSPYAFGSIYYLLFFKILNEEQKEYVENNKYSVSFTTNILRLSISQFIEIVFLIKPYFRQIRYYEDVIKKVDFFKKKLEKIECQIK